MASNKILEVLCLNGRRQKVKTTPSMTIMQVLQEVCKKQGFNASEVDLIHQRKALDVTATIRYTNIANNSTLEMVKRNCPRKVSNVNIVIQTDSGERLQHQFDPSFTIFDVLKHFEGEPGSLRHGKILCKIPVVIYMTHKVKGIESLKETSLESLGLIGGNAALRLVHEEQTEIGRDIQKETRDETGSTGDSVGTNLNAESEKKKKDESSMVNTKNDIPGSFEKKRNEQELTHLSSGEVAEPLVKRAKLPTNDSIGGTCSMPEAKNDTFTKEEIERVAAVTHPFAQFKFPETRTLVDDGSNVEAIDPKQLMKEEKLSMPCDRRGCVFDFNDVDLKSTNTEEPNDSFFEPTIEDLRLRVQGLKSVSSDDSPLTTKNMKAAKNMEKVFQYKQVIIRIQFPGRIVLQGVFRPLEKVKAVKDFVKEHLQDKNTKFDLYTTPPKYILKKLDQTLHEAKLIPTALVHVSCENPSENLLRKEFIDSSVTFLEAEKNAFDILQRHMPQNPVIKSSVNYDDTVNVPSSKAERNPTTSEFMTTSASRPTSTKVPKWFKTGK